jgi:hypothetical protein
MGGDVLPSVSSAPLAVDGLVLRAGGKTRFLLANLTDHEQRLQVGGVEIGKPLSMRSLNETNAEFAMTSPEAFREHPGEILETLGGHIEILLRPYALARIDQKYP